MSSSKSARSCSSNLACMLSRLQFTLTSFARGPRFARAPGARRSPSSPRLCGPGARAGSMDASWPRAGGRGRPVALHGAKLARRAAAPALSRGGPFPGARLPQHAVAGPRLPPREAALAGGGPCPGAPLSQFATAPARREAVPAGGGPRLEPRGATGGNRRREERSGRRLAACCKEGRQRPQLSAAATRRSPSSSLAASLGRDLDGSPVACSPARAGAAPPPRAGLGRWEAARLHQRALGLAASRGGRSVLSRISGHGGGRLCSRRRPDVQASAGANGSTGLGVLRPVSKKGKYVFLHLRQPP